jgi:hypothetical protein
MREFRILGLLIILQFTLTTVHHLYGEFFLYKDGVRLHVVFMAPIALLLTFAPLWLHRSSSFGRGMFIFWCTLLWALGIGFFEGFWNHIVVNSVYALGLTDSFSHIFYRAVPGDLVFEITGIAQFFVACALLIYSVLYIKKIRGSREMEIT